jgi:predicted acylesterase/phospholipase RssA
MVDRKKKPDDAYQGEDLPECDLVMKGGITSGVVYPPAILELAKNYRLRGIGGASAGAIAAGAAAAAEYGRRDPRKGAGFRGLAAFRAQLEEGGLIERLFEPAPETRTLFRLLTDLQRSAAADPSPGGPGRLVWLWRISWALLRRAPIGVVVGTLAAAAVAHFVVRPRPLLEAASHGGVETLLALVAVLFVAALCWMGALAGGALWVKRGVDALCSGDRTFYGICPGSRGPAKGPEQLTDWLHAGINAMAGYGRDDRPLTIDELATRGIDFKMVTTNLSHARPYVLPRNDGGLLFRGADFDRLFPPSVVAYLKRPDTRDEYAEAEEKRGQRSEDRIRDREVRHGSRLPEGYYPLPRAGRLPVIVAVRLSLSFPLLLSAVRLYSVADAKWKEMGARKARKEKEPLLLHEEDLVPNWFSDGGIAANFPLGMFDRWMPARPTFGINLCDGPVPSRLATRAQGGAVVRLAASDTSRSMPHPAPIRGLMDLLLAMLDTARSARDNVQMGLASYRERVAHVYLEREEGGLNLSMGHETLVKIGQKGEVAARTFLGTEGQPAFNFDEHRWVRLRQLMDHLERELFAARDVAGSRSMGGGIKRLFARQEAARKARAPWYRPEDEEWCQEAERRMNALFEMIEKWEPALPAVDAEGTDAVATFRGAPATSTGEPFFQSGPPKPAGTLRVTSEV